MDRAKRTLCYNCPMEMVDIVNDQDQVTESTTKAKAHQLGLLHRCVVAEVVDANNQLLLVRQAADKQDPGQLVSPVGGHVASGETWDEALIREAAEELGISDFPYSHLGQLTYNREVLGRKENHLFRVYLIHSNESITLNNESTELVRFGWPKLVKAIHTYPEWFGDPFHLVYQAFCIQLSVMVRSNRK